MGVKNLRAGCKEVSNPFCNVQIAVSTILTRHEERAGSATESAVLTPGARTVRKTSRAGGGACAAGSGGKAGPRPQRRALASLPRPLHAARAGLRRKGTEGGDVVNERRLLGSGSRGSSAAVAAVSRPDVCWLTGFPLKLAKAGPQSELPQYLDPRRGRCR